MLGVFLLALTYNLFFLPNDLVIGGTTGLAVILKDVPSNVTIVGVPGKIVRYHNKV